MRPEHRGGIALLVLGLFFFILAFTSDPRHNGYFVVGLVFIIFGSVRIRRG